MWPVCSPDTSYWFRFEPVRATSCFQASQTPAVETYKVKHLEEEEEDVHTEIKGKFAVKPQMIFMSLTDTEVTLTLLLVTVILSPLQVLVTPPL